MSALQNKDVTIATVCTYSHLFIVQAIVRLVSSAFSCNVLVGIHGTQEKAEYEMMEQATFS